MKYFFISMLLLFSMSTMAQQQGQNDAIPCDTIEYAEPVTFMGMEFGTDRTTVRFNSLSRFGIENCVCWDDKEQDVVLNVQINQFVFDMPIFFYNKENKLVSAGFSKSFSKKDVQQYKKLRDELAELYSQKYGDCVAFILDNGFKGYACGIKYFSEKYQDSYYPITIEIEKTSTKDKYVLKVKYYETERDNWGLNDI